MGATSPSPPDLMTRFLLLLLLSLTVAETADAQIWRRARDAARRGAERAVERQADRAGVDHHAAAASPGQRAVCVAHREHRALHAHLGEQLLFGGVRVDTVP